MMDLTYIGIAVAFFAVCALLIQFFDRLLGAPND